jgi:hypothetical protein
MAVVEQQDVNRKRKPRMKDVVAARVKVELQKLEPETPREGVHVLNPGFFLLQSIRKNKAAKAKTAKRAKLKES